MDKFIIVSDYTSSQWIWLCNFSVILDNISYLIVILGTNFRINTINRTLSVTNGYRHFRKLDNYQILILFEELLKLSFVNHLVLVIK